MKKTLFFVLLAFSGFTAATAQCPINTYTGFGGYGPDKGQVILTDTLQNVYICGFFTDSIQLGTFNLLTDSSGQFLCKISPSGAVLWAKGLYNNDGVAFYPPKLLLDYSGQLIVAGTCQTPNADFDTIVNAFTNGDLFISKFDVNTGELKSFLSTGRHLYTYIIDADIDSSNNLYLAGMFVGVTNFGTLSLSCSGQTNSYIAKFDSSGVALWAQRITTSPTTTGNRADNIDYDRYNSIYLSGWYGINAGFGSGVTLNSTTYTNGFLAKYDLNGNIKWAKSSDTNVVFNFQAINDTASIMVLQASPDKIIRYNQKGDTISTTSVSSSVSGSIFSKFIQANGKYYGTGSFYNSITLNDSIYSAAGPNIFIASLNLNGTTDYVRTISSTGSIQSYDISVDNQDNVSLTGLYGEFDTINQTISMPGWGNSEVLFIKRCNNLAGISEAYDASDNVLIYPNPAQNSIHIILDKSEKIVVSNVLGKILFTKTFVCNVKSPVEINISDLLPGIYFIRAGGLTGKFVKE